MKTKQEIIEIIKNKVTKGIFCKDEGRKALEFVESFPENATLEEISQNISSQWAYFWAFRIGDQEVMRDRVTESEYAYRWARGIGDQEIMRERVTNPEYTNLFNERFPNPI
jgi:hypothetical protein